MSRKRSDGRSNRPYRESARLQSNRGQRVRRRRLPPLSFTRKMQKKLAVIFIIVLLALLGLNYQITKIQKENGEQYAKQVLSQQGYSSASIPYRRGDITDVNGTILATSEEVYNVIIDAKQLLEKDSYLEPTLAALESCFGDKLDIQAIRTHVSEKPESQYYVAAKKLTKDEIRDFEALLKDRKNNPDIAGVWFEKDYVRRYPYDTLACDLLGFTVSGNQGVWGIEEYYNDTLNGINGREYGYLNEDSELQKTVKEAEDGKTVVSTIDANIQKIVEDKLKEFNELHANEAREGLGSKNSAVIVMDPDSGELLAMAGYPAFNLNNPRDLMVSGLYSQEEIDAMDDTELGEAYYSLWRNYCISDGYEPGSTVKTLTISAGLETGKVRDGDPWTCVGSLEVGDHTIHCSNVWGHGVLTTDQALMKSCNAALMQMAMRIGNDDFMKYMDVFNLGKKTGIDLPGEAAGLKSRADEMTITDLAAYSFGQGYNTTMVQVASAFCSVVNGGTYYQPHVVKEIVDRNGATVKSVEPVVMKRTVSEQTSETMKRYLYHVVAGDGVMTGTGGTAAVEGYRIGGKTGTAEKLPRDKKNYVISFIGAAPIDDPQVVVYVVIDEPNVEDQAHSTYAQEVFASIMKDILPYMNIYPTESVTQEQPAEGQEEEAAKEEAAGESDESDQQKVVVTETGRVIDGLNIDPEYAAEHNLDPNTGEPLDGRSVLPDGYSGVADNDEDTMTGDEKDALDPNQ
ncbi:MAG: penicillin-binding protein 2 [Lachnospiraceae bacterium]|nr:penicillin-binding protein 2 [Lachnospiraceae bacterium]